MTNLKDLSKTFDNFVRKMKTVVELDRLRKTVYIEPAAFSLAESSDKTVDEGVDVAAKAFIKAIGSTGADEFDWALDAIAEVSKLLNTDGCRVL